MQVADTNGCDFFALSYEWGDPTLTALVSVDGVGTSVTRNLHDALRRIRTSWWAAEEYEEVVYL